MSRSESYIFKLAAIIVRSFKEELSPEEHDFLEDWLQVAEKNKSLYSRMQEEDWLVEKMRTVLKIEATQDCVDFIKHYHESRKLYIRKLIVRYVAIVLFFLSAGAGYWYLKGFEPADSQLAGPTVPVDKKEVILTLGSGEQLILQHADSTAIREESGTLLNISGNQLSYLPLPETTVRQIEYNELYIPRGGEYFLSLTDGTKVWLNSESSLRYPVVFNGQKRIVYLEGEAFFRVAEDPQHPFVVMAGNSKTEVLGTEFNLRAYPDEAVISATLVKGSVRLSVAEEQQGLVLSPGEQGNVVKVNGLLSKHLVDIYLYTSWKDGRFVFKSSRMEDLLEVLSRWYDVEIFYQNPAVKDLRFTGDLCKTEHIDALLNIIEQNGLVAFERKEDSIVVKTK